MRSTIRDNTKNQIVEALASQSASLPVVVDFVVDNKLIDQLEIQTNWLIRSIGTGKIYKCLSAPRAAVISNGPTYPHMYFRGKSLESLGVKRPQDQPK